MSAWIVSKGHIDVLVNGLVQHRIIEPVQMAETGQMLWKENHRSVNARYDERTRTPKYHPTGTEATVGSVHLLAAAGCYDYQSCEHAGWAKSEARRLVQALVEAVHKADPDAEVDYRAGSQFKDWKWGYDSLQEALVHG